MLSLVKIAIDLERGTNKNTLGHGEFACQFCDGRGAGIGEVKHKETCPTGRLWKAVEEQK